MWKHFRPSHENRIDKYAWNLRLTCRQGTCGCKTRDIDDYGATGVFAAMACQRLSINSTFLSIDFGICEDEEGVLSPQLIEIQGFPSLFFYQELCANAYLNHFEIPPHLKYLFGGHTSESYVEKLKKVEVCTFTLQL